MIAVADNSFIRYPERGLGHEQFQSLNRASSLFNRMGFIRRTTTNGKVEIADGARKEAELTFLHEIAIRLRNFKLHPCGYLISIKPNQSIFLSGEKKKKKKWVKRFHIRTYRRLEWYHHQSKWQISAHQGSETSNQNPEFSRFSRWLKTNFLRVY